jgi:hypothetical protein
MARPVLLLAFRSLLALFVANGVVLAQDLAFNKPAAASSQESPTFGPAMAVDNNAATRWSSAFSDPQWLQIDLGSVQNISSVNLVWEAASAKNYTVDVSVNGSTWTTIATKINMAAGARVDNLTGLSGSGRFIRVYGTSRTTSYGYSLFTFSAFGASVPIALPGKVQAEDYRPGGEGVGYHDLTPGNLGGKYRNDDVDIEATTDIGDGYNVGWIDAGEWLAYDVVVPQNGAYKFIARVASANVGTKAMALSLDGVSLGTIGFTTSAGWQTWVDATLDNVALTAGTHVLRVTITGGGFNFNYLNVQPSQVVNQDLALGKPATASSQESATYAPSMAVDGNASTRWSSAFSDPQWIRVDLGSVMSVNTVKLIWEAASAKNYTIDISNDGAAWTTIAARTNMPAGARTDSLGGLSGSGRFIRMNGTARTSAYGYSLYGFEVYGASGTTPVANAGPDRTVNLGLPVTLDGSSSFDPVPGPQQLSFSWRQVGGPGVALTGATTPTPVFIPVDQGVYIFELTVFDGASPATDQVAITMALKPSANGPFAFDRVVYAAPGIDYGPLAVAPILVTENFINRFTNVTFADYQKFSSASYQTHTVDLSQFDYFGGTVFPFINPDGSNIPMNGIMYKPAGNGPFPIVFFVHGQHVPIERSDPGYEPLCALLASNGMIGVTIDENYLNDGGGIGARALMLLEHIKQFRAWNQTPGHPLYQKIDMNNIMIVGHSRGGEAVAIATFFNQLSKQGVTSLRPQAFDPAFPQFGLPVKIDGTGQFGPYQFSLKGTVALAPTTGFFLPVDPADSTKNLDPLINVPYFLISGGRDSDAGNTAGLDTYNSADPFTPTGTSDVTAAIKGHLFLHNANHNYFNTVWAMVPDGSNMCKFGICFDSTMQMSAADQFESLKCFIGAASQSMLRGMSGYLAFFKDKALCGAALPQNPVNVRGASLPIVFNSQFQDNRRLLVNHYEEDAALATASKMSNGIVGINSWTSGLTVSEQLIGSTPAGSYNEHALVTVWSASGKSYQTQLSAPLPVIASTGDTLKTAELRVGFSNSDAENTPAINQDFSFRLKDNAGHQFSVAASATSGSVPVLPKQTYILSGELTFASYPAIFQTVRFPLSMFSGNGVNTAAITEIAIVLDKTAKGRFFIDDIQLTR